MTVAAQDPRVVEPVSVASAESSAGVVGRALNRYITRSAGTPCWRGANIWRRTRVTLTSSDLRSASEILASVVYETISPPRTARSITRAAMLTSTPSQSEPMRCGRPVWIPARIRGV